jgi:hypothetical protein
MANCGYSIVGYWCSLVAIILVAILLMNIDVH